MIKPAIYGRAGQRHRWNPCRPRKPFVGFGQKEKDVFERYYL